MPLAASELAPSQPSAGCCGTAEARSRSGEQILTVVTTREHPAEDVHVTGTFDNWTKSVELEKVGTGFEKLVSLPPSTEKILYKVRAAG